VRRPVAAGADPLTAAEVPEAERDACGGPR
jgi:hypothetical protein